MGGVCKITLLQPLVQAVFNYSFFLEFDLVKHRSGSRFFEQKKGSLYCLLSKLLGKCIVFLSLKVNRDDFFFN